MRVVKWMSSFSLGGMVLRELLGKGEINEKCEFYICHISIFCTVNPSDDLCMGFFLPSSVEKTERDNLF